MRILLATIESAEHAIVARSLRFPHVLTSFFYVRRKRILAPGAKSTLARNWMMAMRQARLRFIDSGGFTLRNAMGAGYKDLAVQGADDADPDRFLHDYVAFLRDMDRLRLADAWCEIDIAAAVGREWVERQRRTIIGAGLGHGLVYVWHSAEHDQDYWLWMLREASRPGRSRYVAIEGYLLPGRPADEDRLPYEWFLREAYRRGVRVHGFKMTRNEDLRRFPFFSVDSSSWNAVVTSGSYTIRDATGGLVQTKRPNRRGVGGTERLTWTGAHVSRGTSARYRLDRLFASARSWLEMEAMLAEMWRRRGVDWDAAIANPEIREDGP